MQAPRPPVRAGPTSDQAFLQDLSHQLSVDESATGGSSVGANMQGEGGMTPLIAAAERGFPLSLAFLVRM